MEDYDCIIIGAGPAGLLLGKELSKKHKILVLEKNKIGETNKNWLTYKDRWIKEKFPKSFIENEFKEWSVLMKYGKRGNKFIIKDNFICFNEHKFLSWLAFKCKKRGVIISDKTKFTSFLRKNNQIVVNKKYSAKILIDCAGINSPIVKKYNLVELPIYINCYAYIGEFDKVLNKNYYCFYRNKNRKHYSSFGFTKIAPKLAQLQYFKYSNNKPDFNKYSDEMKQAQKDFGISKHKMKEFKIASYPTGIIKKREFDNIILFGDAGLYSPSFNGMGFNEILRQYKKVAKHISKCILKNEYSEIDLKIPDDIANDVNNLVFQFLGLIINSLPPKTLNEIFTVIKRFPKKDIKAIMRNDLSDRQVIRFFKSLFNYVTVSEFISAIEKNHAKFILKTLYELNKDIISEETHNLFFKHHKIRIKDMYS